MWKCLHETLTSAAEIADQQAMLQSFHQQRRCQDAQGISRIERLFYKLCNSSGPVPAVRLSSIAIRGRRSDRSRLDMRKTSMVKTTFRLNLAQQAWAERKIAAFAEHCRFSSSAPVVVEVGSFVGGFLAAAQRRGWSIRGVDPGREVVNFCQGRGLSVFYGTLNDATLVE